MTPSGPEPPEQPVSGLLGSVHEQLQRIERLLGPEAAGAREVQRHLVPAWRRATAGEHRLPVARAEGRRPYPDFLFPQISVAS